MFTDQHRGVGTIRCRFCHLVLIPIAKLGVDHGEDKRVNEHTTECAITVVATGNSKPPIAAKKGK